MLPKVRQTLRQRVVPSITQIAPIPPSCFRLPASYGSRRPLLFRAFFSLRPAFFRPYDKRPTQQNRRHLNFHPTPPQPKNLAERCRLRARASVSSALPLQQVPCSPARWPAEGSILHAQNRNDGLGKRTPPICVLDPAFRWRRSERSKSSSIIWAVRQNCNEPTVPR